MSRLDDLPPDQRAVLLLLVRQGRSQAEIAQMLGISEDAVRARAHAALDVLAEEQPAANARAAERPTATAGAAEQLTAGPTATAQRSARTAAPPAHSAGAGLQRLRHASARTHAPRSSSSSRGTGGALQAPRPRTAGAVLLTALVAVIAVVVVLIANSGGSHSASPNGAAATTTTGTGTTAASGTPRIDKRLTLTSPDPASGASGDAAVVSEGSRRAFFIEAQHLAPSSGFFYVAWLYNSQSDAEALGRAPTVTSNGRLQAIGALPANAGSFHQLVITKETSARPSQPGPIVLRGPFSLH